MAQEKIKLGKPEKLPSGKVRWRKMHKGHRWPCPAYDQDSRRNRSLAWHEFKKWRDELDRQLDERQIDDDLRKKFIERHLETLERFQRLTNGGSADFFAKARRNLGNLTDEAAIQQLFEQLVAEVEWLEDRRSITDRAAPAASSTESSAEELADEFVKTYESKAKSSQVSIGRYGQVRAGVARFLDWYGRERPVTDFSEEDVREYYQHLQGQIVAGENQNTVSDAHSVFKLFIESLSEDDRLTKPSNLRSKLYLIPRVSVEPDPFTPAEVELLLQNATETTQLYLLLMLNCGFYQGDVAELKAAEVDWEAGRIIRHRSKKQKRQQRKTRRKAKDTRVNWLLWDRTFELLCKHGNREGVVLTNAKGEPLVKGGIRDDGKEWRIDNIKSAYNRVITKLKKRKLLAKEWHKTPVQFRKVGANLIEESDHAEFYELFLDHTTTAKQSYLTGGKAVPKFDAAVTWVGARLGLSTAR